MLPYILLLATLGVEPAQAASLDDLLKPPTTAFGPQGFNTPSKRGNRKGTRGSSSTRPKPKPAPPRPAPRPKADKPSPKAPPPARPSSPKPPASSPPRPSPSSAAPSPRPPRPATSVPPASPRPAAPRPDASAAPRPDASASSRPDASAPPGATAPLRPDGSAPAAGAPSRPTTGGVPSAPIRPSSAPSFEAPPATTGGVPGTRSRGGFQPDNAGLERPISPKAGLKDGRPLDVAHARKRLGVDRSRFAERLPPATGQRPLGGTRPFEPDEATDRGEAQPPHRTEDHRYARPHHEHVHTHVHAHYVVPSWYHYRPWYTRWYIHPYYRWCYSTSMVVYFGFATYAWMDAWVPPSRWGWTWVPGYWSWGYWHPGYWAPVAPPPPRYVYVPGWWEKEVYVEGYYRVDDRDGWEWVDGYYLEDGTYVRGHWRPSGDAPDGYVWEPGLYDGETWVDGFWRPEHRKGFVWLSSWFDEDGVFHSGYWLPQEDRPGHVWVPGWFDGNQWVEGYWVTDEDYRAADPQQWEPPEGWNAGWDAEEEADTGAPVAAPVSPPKADSPDDLPLALPVVPGEPVED